MDLLIQNPIWSAFKNISDHSIEHLKVWTPSLVIQLQNYNSADSENLHEHL